MSSCGGAEFVLDSDVVNMLQTLTPALSVLFRLAVFVYLRVIPLHRIARFALPALYSLYLLTCAFAVQPKPELVVIPQKIEVIDIVDAKTDEIVEEIVAVEGTAVVVEPANGHAKELPALPSSSTGLVDIFGALLLNFPKSRFLNFIGIAINTLLLLFAADFAYTPTFKEYNPTFTRVGAVDHSSVKVVVRYPGLAEDQLRIVWQRVHSVVPQSDVWKEGPVLDIEEEKDWTASGKITGLWPSAEYVYRLAYLNSTLLPHPESPVAFKTFPDPRSSAGTHFKFLVSSCMMPNFPYNPAFPERIKGMEILSNYIASLQPAPAKVTPSTTKVPADPVEEVESLISDASTAIASATATPVKEIPLVKSILTATKPRELTPEFMIMAGDAIYADIPHYGGDQIETYRKLYRRSFASPSFRKVYEKLPIFSIYDDHEFVNNFAGESDENKAPFLNGSSAFKTYYGNANPDPHQSDVNFYDFRYGDNAFFVLDTRRYRAVPNNSDTESVVPPTMLGEKQLFALHAWLGKVNTTTTFKFIVSSVPFTSLWHGFDGQTETWASYKFERDSLLDVLQYVPNVVILSGDRHEFAFIEHRGKIPEISVSPVSMFAVNSMTLHARSDATIEKSFIDTVHTADGADIEITAIEHIPEERAIHYIASGNYKFASLEVDTRDWRKPTLLLDVIISGKSAYKFEFVGQPVSLSFTSSLTVNIGGALKGVLNKIGLGRTLF